MPKLNPSKALQKERQKDFLTKDGVAGRPPRGGAPTPYNGGRTNHWVRYLTKHPSREAYAEYLRSSSWFGRRTARLRADGYHCTICGRCENLLVHHLTYDRIGNERLADLRTVCRDCHTGLHEVWQPQRRPKPVRHKRQKDVRVRAYPRNRPVCRWCANHWPLAKHNRLCVAAGVDK